MSANDTRKRSAVQTLYPDPNYCGPEALLTEKGVEVSVESND